ncbi:hypothetical protein HELRODRAFT_165506 [Helobdella robusta]|uniref:Uncharacterized protein n=1 Tax=Helobdella robusta TaxID=6412 RepID=T1EWX8_HELRO|nr:hypothetical protein HELRODRAFT_165506 [Helobdella robusta]ESN91468.1 hypothetical protein HELRODRAFT_165506 [Helobdella robusta]
MVVGIFLEYFAKFHEKFYLIDVLPGPSLQFQSFSSYVSESVVSSLRIVESRTDKHIHNNNNHNNNNNIDPPNNPTTKIIYKLLGTENQQLHRVEEQKMLTPTQKLLLNKISKATFIMLMYINATNAMLLAQPQPATATCNNSIDNNQNLYTTSFLS